MKTSLKILTRRSGFGLPLKRAFSKKKTTKDALNQRLTFVVDFVWFNAASYDTLISQASA
jgi:hypothetical protein